MVLHRIPEVIDLDNLCFIWIKLKNKLIAFGPTYGCIDIFSVTLQKCVNHSNETQVNIDIKAHDLNLRL